MYLCQYKDTSETCYHAVFELNGCELYVESFTVDESGFVAMLKAKALDGKIIMLDKFTWH